MLLYKTFLRMLKKIDELTGAVDIYLLTSQKLFSALKLLFPFDLIRKSEEFTFTEKLVKNFYLDLLPAHPKYYSEDPSQYGAACRIGVSVAWKRLLVPWIANIMLRKHWKIIWDRVLICCTPLETVFSNKTMPLLTVQESRSNGLRTTVFLFWIGPHNLQICTLSNMCGDIWSKNFTIRCLRRHKKIWTLFWVYGTNYELNMLNL